MLGTELPEYPLALMRSLSNIDVGRHWKLLFAVAATALVVFAGGCGGDGDETGATTVAQTSTEATEAPEVEPATTDPAADGQDDEQASDGDPAESDTAADRPDSDLEPPARYEVPPNRHQDSGGGSKQFRRPGADNSVQDSGREADRATFKEVAAVVHAFLDSRAAGDAAESCKYLSGGLTGQLLELAKQSPDAPSSCAGIVDALTVPMDAKASRAIARADIGSVRVDGDHAFVLYRGAEAGVHVLPIVHENGQWRLSALGGSILPD